jgi:hypothetical protein
MQVVRVLITYQQIMSQTYEAVELFLSRNEYSGHDLMQSFMEQFVESC